MSRCGWIKLWHKFADNEMWTAEPFTKGQAWVDLLLLANAKNEKKFNGQNFVEYKAGHIYYSVLGLSKRWQWSQGKVRRFLKMLENDTMLCLQNGDPCGTSISIINWGKYQGGGERNGEQTERETESRRRTDGDNKEVYKKYKKNKEEGVFPSGNENEPKVNEQGFAEIDFGFKDRGF